MKVGDSVQNIHSKRITKIKKIDIVIRKGVRTNIYTISNDRFDRDDVITEEEFNKHWTTYYPV